MKKDSVHIVSKLNMMHILGVIRIQRFPISPEQVQKISHKKSYCNRSSLAFNWISRFSHLFWSNHNLRQVEVVAAYGKTELWRAAQRCAVSDFDAQAMPPGEAFLPSSVARPKGWARACQQPVLKIDVR